MNIRVVLVEPEHEGNVGSIARLMKNFGLSQLWLVNPQISFGSEAYARAVHASDLLDCCHIVQNLKQACLDMDWIIGTTAIYAKKSSNLRRTTITPEELAKQSAFQERSRLALLFGREGRGLSNKELDLCDVVVSIPSSSQYQTLNIASASAIIFYELWKKRSHELQGATRAIDVYTKLRLLQFFTELVEKEGLPPHRKRLATKAFRNIVSRAFISQREAHLLLGVFRRAIDC